MPLIYSLSRTPWAILLVAMVWLGALGCGGSYAEATKGPRHAAAPQQQVPPEAAADFEEGEADLQAEAPTSDGVHLGAQNGSLLAAPPPPAGALAQAKPQDKDAAPNSAAATNAAATSDASGVATDAPAAKAAPLLIYTAHVRLGVFQAAAGLDQVEKLTQGAGGYLVKRDDHSITVRVPADKFQAILEEMLELGDVLQRNVAVRDVTEQFHDLQIRLRNAEAVLARMTDLLSKAATIKEALAVEKELARVAGEVERIKGRLKLLRELLAFSTITVAFEAQLLESIDSEVELPFDWLDELGLGNLLRL